MIAQGQVGPIATTASLGAGTQQPLRQGNLQDAIVSELHGRYYETNYRRAMFSAYAAGTVLSLVGTSMTGLMLYNQSTSINMVLTKYNLMISVTSASLTGVVLATGTGQLSAPTGQTVATGSNSNFLGGASPQGLALNAGTFTVAPTAKLLLNHNTAAIQTVGIDQIKDDLEGSIIIPPYGYACFAALGAASAAAAFTGSINWEEVPV
jgi:hypothetical protein